MGSVTGDSGAGLVDVVAAAASESYRGLNTFDTFSATFTATAEPCREYTASFETSPPRWSGWHSKHFEYESFRNLWHTRAYTQAQRKIRITSKRDSAFEILQRFGHFDRLRYRSLILYLRNVRTLNNFFFFNILRRLWTSRTIMNFYTFLKNLNEYTKCM